MPKEIGGKTNFTSPKSNTNLPSARYTQGNNSNNNNNNKNQNNANSNANNNNNSSNNNNHT